MKDNSSGCIARSSPGSKRSYNSTGRIRSWVIPTQGQPPSPLPPNGGQQRTRVCRSWELSCCYGSCEATKKKKKKKNTSPLIISHFPPQSQVFFKKFFKKIFTIFIDFCFRIWYNRRESSDQKKIRDASPPLPPNLLLYHMELGKVKYF